MAGRGRLESRLLLSELPDTDGATPPRPNAPGLAESATERGRVACSAPGGSPCSNVPVCGVLGVIGETPSVDAGAVLSAWKPS